MPARSLVVVLVTTVLASSLPGQQPPPPPPPADSVQVGPSSLPPTPPPPTPEQQQYLQGLRTAGRGVGQIKGAVDYLSRVRARHDTLQDRRAARHLADVCGAARTFLTHGRGAMNASVYDQPVRRSARDLALQVDSLSLIAKECQLTAGKLPGPLAAGLVLRIRGYEAALGAFRAAIGLGNR